MTYYEELGVSANASDDEIRQACKHLAEHGTGPADPEMQRLNGMAQLLLDPASRYRYDRSLMSLAAAVAGEPIADAPSRWDWRGLAPAMIAVAAAILILILGSSPVRPTLSSTYIPEPRPTASQSPAADEDWEPLATPEYQSHIPSRAADPTQAKPAR